MRCPQRQLPRSAKPAHRREHVLPQRRLALGRGQRREIDQGKLDGRVRRLTDVQVEIVDGKGERTLLEDRWIEWP